MTLSELGITKEEILDKVAGHLIDELQEDAKSDIARFVNDEVKNGVRAQVSAVIMDTAKRTFDGTFQPVNHFGEKTGEPTTIRDLFVKQAMEWWRQKVDCNGSPSKDDWGSNKLTMAQWHAKQAMDEIVRDVMKKQFEPIIADARKQLAAAFTQAIHELVQRQLAK